MRIYALIFLLLPLLAHNVAGANLLFISPALSGSLLISIGRVADVLVESGHNVTFWIPELFPVTGGGNGSRLAQQVIRTSSLADISMDAIEQDVFSEQTGTFASRMGEDQAMVQFCESILQQKELLERLRQSKFDLAFDYFIDICFAGVIHHLGIPRHIWISSGPIPDAYNWILGIPQPLSISPGLQQTVLLGPKMNTWERVQNIVQFLLSCYSQSLLFRGENALFKKYISADFPQLESLAAKTDLVFMVGDQFLNPALPTLTKVIHIGGLGLSEPCAKISGALLDAVESGAKGAVFFSMGTISNTTLLDRRKLANLYRAFGSFPEYSFIVKSTPGDKVTPKLADGVRNIHLFHWVPQVDLLAHPRLRLFISHAGYNSLLESAVRGVPVLTIPLFFDQNRNAKSAEYRQFARVLSKSDLLDKSKVAAEIGEMLTNPGYAEAAKRLSKLFLAKPYRPESEVVQWTDFVLSNGPLGELVPESVGMSLVEYLCLDIALLALVAVGLLAWIALKTLGLLLALIRRMIVGGKSSRKQKEQ